MPFADINGFKMHYEVCGQGPPLVVAHGVLSNITMAQLLGEVPTPLAEDFTVITYDSRGHGASGGTTEVSDYHWEPLAEDLLGLLRHLGIESSHFSGSSMGGGTILVFALKHPEMVRRIVLLSPPPVGQQQSAPGAALLGGLALLVEGLGLEEAVRVVMRFKLWDGIRETSPAIFEWMRQWLLSLNPQAVVPAVRGIVYGPALDEQDFTQVRAPTLLIAHPNDEMHPVASAELLHARIPDSQLMIAPDAFYYSLRREELAGVMKTFLNGG